MSLMSALKRIQNTHTINTTLSHNNKSNNLDKFNHILLNKDSLQIYIGRDIECNYRITSIEISRKHALIEYSSTDNYWNLSDLNSTNGLFVNAVQLESFSPYRLVDGDKVSFGPPNQSQFCYQFIDKYPTGGVGLQSQQVSTTQSSSIVGTGVGQGSTGRVSYELSAIGLSTIPTTTTVIPIVTRIQTSNSGSGGGAAIVATSHHNNTTTNTLRFNIDTNQSRTISLTTNMPTTRSGINYSVSTTTSRSPRMSTGGLSGGHNSGSTGGRRGIRAIFPIDRYRVAVRDVSEGNDDRNHSTTGRRGHGFVEHDYSSRRDGGGNDSSVERTVRTIGSLRAKNKVLARLKNQSNSNVGNGSGCSSAPTGTGQSAAKDSVAAVVVKSVSESERKRFDRELQKLEKTKRSLEERKDADRQRIRRKEDQLKRQQRELERKEREAAKREQELDKMRKELTKEKRRLQESRKQSPKQVANPSDTTSPSVTKRKLKCESARDQSSTKRQCNDSAGKSSADNDLVVSNVDVEVLMDSKSKPIEEIFESEMTCSVCHEFFVHAVNLNCSHTFCHACIEEWKHSKPGAHHHVCPICRKRIENQNRELVLDNLIDRFVAKMKPELAEHREKLVTERKKRLEEVANEAAAGRAANGAHSRGRQVLSGLLPSLHFFLSHRSRGQSSGGQRSSESDGSDVNVIGFDIADSLMADAGSDSDSSSISSVSSSSSSSDSSSDDSSDDDSDDDNNNVNVNNATNNFNNDSSDDSDEDSAGIISISTQDFAANDDSDNSSNSSASSGPYVSIRSSPAASLAIDSDDNDSVMSVVTIDSDNDDVASVGRSSSSGVSFVSDFSDND